MDQPIESPSGGPSPKRARDTITAYDGNASKISTLSQVKAYDILAKLNRFGPFKLKWNEKRQKNDKVPRYSTNQPRQWEPLDLAINSAKLFKADGIGLLFTNGVKRNNKLLLGFDFDGVDFDTFKYPFKGYWERSISGTGLRSFAWVKKEWAEPFKDTLKIQYAGCDHLECYIGSSARFLTLTGDSIDDSLIPTLAEADLAWLTPHMKKKEDQNKAAMPVQIIEGRPINLNKYSLSEDQKLLLAGDKTINRSDILYGLLIMLFDAGESKADIKATLLKIPALWLYLTSHRSGGEERAIQFADEEIQRAYEKSIPGMQERLTAYNQLWKPLPPRQVESETLPFPMELYTHAPGLVGEVARWIMGASYSPRPEFAYACALSMVACLIGPYCTHAGNRFNLYLSLVGGTGTGKNEGFDTMAILLAATDAKDAILGFPASEAALRRRLSQSPNVLIRIDELAHKLESLQNSGNSSGAGLMGVILEAYTGARMPPKDYADEKKSLPAVEHPYVQIISGTTDKVWSVLHMKHVEDGTLNRFIFVCLPDSPEYSHNSMPDKTVPKEFKDRLNAFLRDGRRYDLLGFVPPGMGRNIQYGEGVQAALDALNRTAWEVQQERKEFAGLYNRYAQNVGKIAGILAVGDGRLIVEMGDFEQGRRFMEWCLENTYQKCQAGLGDNSFTKLAKRLLKKLKDKGGQLGMREAYRALSIKRREMEELTMTLMLSGEIEVFKEEDQSEWIRLVSSQQ